jgi:D-alanyl-lipoteichoic acid acyltransferase DltB (MBOAT superfamily)
LVFTLIGFWHGASWNFIIVGFIHGIFIILQSLYKTSKYLPQFKGKIGGAMLVVWNLHILMLCGIFFRNKSITDCITAVEKIASQSLFSTNILPVGFSLIDFLCCALVSFIFLLSSFFNQELKFKNDFAFILVIITLTYFLGSNASDTFIYFQF